MSPKLKPLRRQVMVITGATSGIGLVTARQAADAGVRLVLTARDRSALQELTQELNGEDADAVYVAADVANEDEMRSVADTALQHFGGFDTWVNNAGVSVYGKLEEVSLEDQRRLFETNYWGVVIGSRVACEHLRQHGGALINIGSALSDRAIPIQGAYSASKAAVKGFTDALRMELEADGAPVSVTLIKPATINTPYQDRAANYLDFGAKNPPPVYDPETVSRAILHAATHRERDVVVGAGAAAFGLANLFPRVSDIVMRRAAIRQQQSDQPEPGIRKHQLHEPGQELAERGGYSVHFGRSLYTAAGRHKVATTSVALGAAALLYNAARSRARR